MTPALALCLVFGLSVAAPDLQLGAHALFQLQTSVTTRTARAGDPVPLRTASPLVIDGVSIPIGSQAQGVVTHARRPGRIRGRGELEIAIRSIARPDGTAVPLGARFSAVPPPRRRPAPYAHRPSDSPRVRAAIVVGMVAGYGTAALVSKVSNSAETVGGAGLAAGATTAVLVGMMKRGEELVLRSGQIIEVLLPGAI
jgi:hypothetical protein